MLGLSLVLSLGVLVLVDLGASSVGLYSLGTRSRIARAAGRCGGQDVHGDLRFASLCVGKRFFWNGETCAELRCPCEGLDCGDVFPSQAACAAAFAHCGPTPGR
jgi:hypothetical protein